jgi:hypothetical protein
MATLTYARSAPARIATRSVAGVAVRIGIWGYAPKVTNVSKQISLYGAGSPFFASGSRKIWLLRRLNKETVRVFAGR